MKIAPLSLLSADNGKTEKGEARGWLTGVLQLAPGRIAGRGNVCPHSDECLAKCIFSTGNGRYETVRAARVRRTRQLFDSPRLFVARLIGDIATLAHEAERLRMRPALRLNGFSDVHWWRDFPEVLKAARDFGVTPYDYTKTPQQLADRPAWYDLTFSLGSRNVTAARQALSEGVRVAAILKPVPEVWRDGPFGTVAVLNGDENDLRFLDPSPSIIGLTPKGKAIGHPGRLVRNPN